MAVETKTTCPYCGVGCGIIATQKSDGKIEVKGDPDHPANFGRLCSKGSALAETLDQEGRLLFPEINSKRADWDTALDLIASKFSNTIKESGPDSVAFYVSGQLLTEDYYVANKLMKGFIGSGNIDTNSRLCMASSVAGHRRAFGSDTVPGVYEDLEQADVVVLVGSNMLWCHPVLFQRIETAKAARPSMKVVVIDPRRTKTADLCDLHLAIEPDSDCALFLGLLNWLNKNGITEPEWIQKHTTGFEITLESADQWSPEKVAKATGLSKDQVLTFYTLWSNTEKVVTAYSQGVNQSACGTDKVNAIINCHLATARIGREGMGPFSLTGQPNAMGGRETGGLANMLAAHMDLESEADRERVSRFWNAPNLTEKPGLKAIDMFKAVRTGKIKALWIMATNPVVSMPDAAEVETAIANCEFVVVSDIMKETDTARHAHVKLPSLGWGEKDGLVTNSERRMSRQRAFLPSPGTAKADWWQLAQVGTRMGWASEFNYTNAAEIFREFAALTALENQNERDLDLSALSEISDISYETLPSFQWPQKTVFNSKHQTRFFADGNFYTPDRKARFVPVSAKRADIETKNLLWLNTGRIRDHWHTMTRTAKAARLNAHISEPYCEIHPDDAKAHNIQAAELVSIKGQKNRITVRALLSEGQKKGHVFIPMHWNDQFASNARVDTLVPPVTDPFSGQPALKRSQITLEPASLSYHGFGIFREKPIVDHLDYWAIAKADNGWRLEFALKSRPTDCASFLAKLIQSDSIHLEASDSNRHFWRAAKFDGTSLVSAAFLSLGPVEVSRSWAVAQLGENFDSPQSRWRVLAGRPAIDTPEKGAIVCSCMSVGINEIVGAVNAGCHSVQAVGQNTQAGTNCGSCRAEITEIINAHRLIAAE